MKAINLFILFIVMFGCMPAIADEIEINAQSAALYNPETTDRILLIGFSDRSIHKISGPLISPSYRRRGNYQSSSWSQRITAGIENEYKLKKLTEWPMTEVGVHCAVYQVPREQSVDNTIEKLSHDTRVQIVQKMHQFKTQLHQYNDPYFKLQYNLHELEIDQVHGLATGKNVTIAMIDTGVDAKHPDLAGQIKITKNLASGISASFFDDLHGTAIAGTMVAQKNNKTGIVGIAPNARLIALKACWPDKRDSYSATCNSFTLALAVNTAIKLGADILNMSLAGPRDPLVEILLKKADEKGVIVIAANPAEDKMNFPASLENVISVSANPSQATQKHPFSAPGNEILTTLPHGTYDFVSGSSISAAQVSGIIALLLELKPSVTRSEIYNILQKSTIPLCKSIPKSHTNRVNALTAIMEICNDIVCSEYM